MVNGVSGRTTVAKKWEHHRGGGKFRFSSSSFTRRAASTMCWPDTHTHTHTPRTPTHPHTHTPEVAAPSPAPRPSQAAPATKSWVPPKPKSQPVRGEHTHCHTKRPVPFLSLAHHTIMSRTTSAVWVGGPEAARVACWRRPRICRAAARTGSPPLAGPNNIPKGCCRWKGISGR